MKRYLLSGLAAAGLLAAIGFAAPAQAASKAAGVTAGQSQATEFSSQRRYHRRHYRGRYGAPRYYYGPRYYRPYYGYGYGYPYYRPYYYRPAPFPFFADHRHDPDLADAVRNGRREEFAAFGWRPDEVADPEDAATFASAVLDWDEPGREPYASLLGWYRALIDLRAAEPALRDGDLERVETTHDEEQRTLAVRRGPVGLVLALGTRPATVALPGGALADEVLLASAPGVVLADGAVTLPPDSVAIVRVTSRS